MLGAAIGWAVYSIFLINWKSKFSLMARFTLVAFFGAICLLPFYIIEESFFFNTTFNNNMLTIKFRGPFKPRRGRINCSLNDNGKWRWFGIQFPIKEN